MKLDQYLTALEGNVDFLYYCPDLWYMQNYIAFKPTRPSP